MTGDPGTAMPPAGSRTPARRAAPKPLGRTIGHVGLALTVAFAGIALGAGY
jgi:hypothetical protein